MTDIPQIDHDLIHLVRRSFFYFYYYFLFSFLNPGHLISVKIQNPELFQISIACGSGKVKPLI
jgi:hypothetical protein